MKIILPKIRNPVIIAGLHFLQNSFRKLQIAATQNSSTLEPQDWNRNMLQVSILLGKNSKEDVFLNCQQPTARKLALPVTSLLNTRRFFLLTDSQANLTKD